VLIAALALLAACAKPVGPEASSFQRGTNFVLEDFIGFMATHGGALSDQSIMELSTCNLETCFEVGNRISTDTRASTTQALPFFLRACGIGNDKACIQVANALVTNRSIERGEPDYFEGDKLQIRAKHLAYAERSCAINDDNCVFWAGHAINSEVASARTQRRAQKTLENSCEEGAASACYSLGYFYSLPTEDSDPSTSTDYYRQSCDNGEDSETGRPAHCLAYARALYHGIGVQPDPQASLQWLGDRCSPDTALWEQHCSGEPGTEEQCGLFFVVREGKACALKGSALIQDAEHDQDDALRVLNVACRAHHVSDQSDADLMVNACEQALAIHQLRQTPEAMLSSLRNRTCTVKAEECTARLGITDEVCSDEKRACLESIPN
jgi:TPR repeat protein